MKNTKLFIYTLLACLVLWVGFDISAARLKFGGATLNDSTASLITTKKGFLVNGKLSTSNYADFSNGVRFGDTDITIDDDGLDLRYIVENGGQHIFTTKTGTELATIDSAGGAGFRQIQGRGLVYEKLVKFATTAASIPTFINSPHGLTGSKIISVVCLVKADTTGWNLSGSPSNDPMFPPRCPLSPAVTYDVFYDSLNVSIYLASTATAIRNNTDSALVWIKYIVE